MGKSKLGTPFKLKNQGAGGFVGSMVESGAKSTLQVLKLKYPDVFETPEEKFEKEKINLLKKQADLAERKFLFDVKKEAEDWAEELQKMELEAKAKKEQAQYDSTLRKQEEALKMRSPDVIARAAASQANAKATIQDIEQKDILFPTKKETEEVELETTKTERDVAKLEADVLKSISPEALANLKTLPIDQYNLEVDKLTETARNNMAQLDWKKQEAFIANQLKAINIDNINKYRSSILAIRQYEAKLKAEGDESGTSKVSNARTFLMYGMQMLKEASFNINVKESAALLAAANMNFQKYNQEMIKMGKPEAQIPLIEGYDKKTKTYITNEQDLSGKIIWEKIEEEPSIPGLNLQTPKWDSATEWLQNEWLNKYPISELQTKPAVFGEKKNEEKITLPSNLNPILKDYGEALINSRVGQIANHHGIEIEEVLATIKVESSFKPNATSKAGAKGLMQLMPATANDMGISKKERVIPDKNIEAGIKYLGNFKKQGIDTVENRAWAYNAGPVNYNNNILPNETKNHIPLIVKNYNFYKDHPEEVVKAINNIENMIKPDNVKPSLLPKEKIKTDSLLVKKQNEPDKKVVEPAKVLYGKDLATVIRSKIYIPADLYDFKSVVDDAIKYHYPTIQADDRVNLIVEPINKMLNSIDVNRRELYYKIIKNVINNSMSDYLPEVNKKALADLDKYKAKNISLSATEMKTLKNLIELIYQLTGGANE